jgi:hypothetical protein
MALLDGMVAIVTGAGRRPQLGGLRARRASLSTFIMGV